MKILHTSLYGIRTRELITGLMSYAQWQLRAKAQTYKTNSALATKVKVADDNEITFELCDTWRHGCCTKPAFAEYNWSDAKTLDHIGWLFKNAIMRDIKRAGGAWKRNDETLVKVAWTEYNNSTYKDDRRELTFTAKEVYCIYDMLRGRKTARYGKEFVDELVSIPLDPISTEMKIAQREEIEKLRKELKLKLEALTNEQYKKIEEMRGKIRKEYDKLAEDARAETDKKIKEIETLIDNAKPMAALLMGAELGA